jgi:hypothetical protein
MPSRCSKDGCKRKLPLTAFACRCNLVFCDTHRYPDEHSCSYKFYEINKLSMEKNLSTITFTKKESLLETI